jgi:hypothetical protein
MWNDGKPLRSWQEITQEASRTNDPERLKQLMLELERAFEMRDKIKPPQPRSQRRQQSA